MKTRRKKTVIENELMEQLVDAKLDEGVYRNCKFIPKRKFEADFYWPELKLVVECDGGVWLPSGGHTTGAGYTSDRYRDLIALSHGIITLRFVSSQIHKGDAIAYLSSVIPLLREGGDVRDGFKIPKGFGKHPKDASKV